MPASSRPPRRPCCWPPTWRSSFWAILIAPGLLAPLALWPVGAGFWPWQIGTYAFLHGSFNHLFFNMLGLWMFGGELEHVWGQRSASSSSTRRACVAAALTQLLVNALLGSVAPTVGASGGLFGLLLAFAMIFPNRIILLFFVIPMKAKYLVALYGLIELYQGAYILNSGVAHFAHLGGMLGGLLTLRYWRGQAPFGRR